MFLFWCSSIPSRTQSRCSSIPSLTHGSLPFPQSIHGVIPFPNSMVLFRSLNPKPTFPSPNTPHPGQETPLACSDVSPIQRHGGFVPQFSPPRWFFNPSLALPPLSLFGTSIPFSCTHTPFWYFYPALTHPLSLVLPLVL